MAELITYSTEEIIRLTQRRRGETKLGERISVLSDVEQAVASNAKYVLLGICEDIGVRANFGIGGTATAWEPALKALLNVQVTERLPAKELALLGYLSFEQEMASAKGLDPANASELEELRNLVKKVDDAVGYVASRLFLAGKIPLVIGGGHNNSYPLLKAFSGAKAGPVNVINVDAHADFRAREGRHSGNGFSYAFNENYLGKYAVLGMHENYNSDSMIIEMAEYPDRIQMHFFEEFLKETTSFDKAFNDCLNFTDGQCGLEIDLDCIAGTLTSAMTPTGFSVEQIRELIIQSKPHKFQYFHLAEGAQKLDNGLEHPLMGKLIAYLITDFIKAQH